jgi:hypothetical protein
MKVRKGFVSNSSSSSFICEISGEIETSCDTTYKEIGFAECENGHTFCSEFLLPGIDDLIKLFDPSNIDTKITTVEDIDAIIKDRKRAEEMIKCESIYDIANYYEVPKVFCPICQMEKFSKDELIDFLLKESNTTIEKLSKVVKERFSNYKDFKEYLE